MKNPCPYINTVILKLAPGVLISNLGEDRGLLFEGGAQSRGALIKFYQIVA